MGIGISWPTLIRNRTVEENLLLAARLACPKDGPKQLAPKVKKVLGLVGLSGFERKYPVDVKQKPRTNHKKRNIVLIVLLALTRSRRYCRCHRAGWPMARRPG